MTANTHDAGGTAVERGAKVSARSAVVLAVNGVLHEISGALAFGTLSDYLRHHLRLTGTKIVCSEGDCGACSVLVGELVDGEFEYRSVDSCIAFVYQLDGCHVITVDGLAAVANAQDADALHPVQRAMAENYGSQCGFCTPGFVIAIADHVDRSRRTKIEGCPSRVDDDVGVALSGNLCRCTGYVQILDAVRAVEAVEPSALKPLNQLYPEESFAAILRNACFTPLALEHDGYSVHVPRSEEELLRTRALNPQARVVAGATDLGVRFNKGQLEASDWVHLRHDIDGFNDVSWDEADRSLTLGAAVRWTDTLEVFDRHAPEFSEVLRRFGGPQIRNMGTIGGNLMNASPIADSLPFLYVSEAELLLASKNGRRRVPIADFYLGYKSFDLAPDELLQSVRFRVADPDQGEKVLLLKASRRRDLDISTFTAALWLTAEKEREVGEARLAYGGVGPTVVRLERAEKFLKTQTLTQATFQRAGEIAAEEITPISDLRGAATYRKLLAKNVMLRFAERLGISRDGGEEPGVAQ